jgi:hypothetical protein
MSLATVSDDIIQRVLYQWLQTDESNIRVSWKDFRFMSTHKSFFRQFVSAEPSRTERFYQTVASLN